MKNLKKIMSAVSALSLTLAAAPSAFSAGALTTELNGFTQEEADKSAVKPHIYATSELISIDEAKLDKERRVSIVVEGAAGKYSAAAFRVYFDKRLTISTSKMGDPAYNIGNATMELSKKVMMDPTAAEQNMVGLFTTAAAKGNYGGDGVMYTFEVTLPDDVTFGDAFPIDIVYKSEVDAKCFFTNTSNDPEGMLMQAYTFTRGINNGETRSFDPSKDAIDRKGNVISDIAKKCSGIASLDPAVDGVIAIGDEWAYSTTSININPTTKTTSSTTTATTTKTTPSTSGKPFTFDGLSDTEIDASPVKPFITVDSKLISYDDAKENQTVSVNVDVSGAEGNYSSVGIHVYFDNRLEVAKNSDGTDDITTGDASKYLIAMTRREQGADGRKSVYFSSSSSGEKGLDGTLMTINFTLPEDFRKGDVFPIDISYVSNANASDMFTGRANTTQNKLMNAFTFTRGIYNSDTNYNFTAPDEHVSLCKALAKIDRSVDGYIAIADGENSEEEIIYGDSNGDGAVNIADATAIVQFIANPDRYPLTEAQKKSADCYHPGDGVTPLDAYAIQILESGRISNLPFLGDI